MLSTFHYSRRENLNENEDSPIASFQFLFLFINTELSHLTNGFIRFVGDDRKIDEKSSTFFLRNRKIPNFLPHRISGNCLFFHNFLTYICVYAFFVASCNKILFPDKQVWQKRRSVGQGREHMFFAPIIIVIFLKKTMNWFIPKNNRCFPVCKWISSHMFYSFLKFFHFFVIHHKFSLLLRKSNLSAYIGQTCSKMAEEPLPVLDYMPKHIKKDVIGFLDIFTKWVYPVCRIDFISFFFQDEHAFELQKMARRHR